MVSTCNDRKEKVRSGTDDVLGGNTESSVLGSDADENTSGYTFKSLGKRKTLICSSIACKCN